ncbi:hypothetical protein AUJ46_03650 [Candidatus Peregrinibacteria bacterium CG1_02_54_53]|nr:MAG: hypothetical protein AUJ46_03650 [Candidatus Peregrinibacteria bacterium CG1_02_54_53]
MSYAQETEEFHILLEARRPELLNGWGPRAALEHNCRVLGSSPHASEEIHWDADVAPCGAHCDDLTCTYREHCLALMQSGEKL